MMNMLQGVQWRRRELEAVLDSYETIADCLEGEKAVKAKQQRYLPDPSGIKCKPAERKKRYDDYIKRAQFYNFTRRTQQGLCGQVFSKPPTIQLPTRMQMLEKSISGDGVAIQQQAKQALQYTLCYSRAGLLVDFPDTRGQGASVADLENGVRATVTLYGPTDITNWRVEDINADEVLTLLVLREVHQLPSKADSFALIDEVWFRVYRLTAEGVTCEIHKPTGSGTEYYHTDLMFGQSLPNDYYVAKRVRIVGGDGPLKRIPFFFIGLEANSAELESPAFYDIASLNISHYRNSADFEEMIHKFGQPTAVVNGLTEKWLENVLGGTIEVGVQGGLPLPPNSDAKFMQIEESSELSGALDRKERQAVALGAKLVEEKQVQRTATEAKIESTAEGSVLQSAAQNVSRAYQDALAVAADMMRVVPSEADPLTFELNTEFDLSKMTADDLRAAIESMQGQLISWTEGRKVARAFGIASQDDDEAKEEIDKKATEDDERAAHAAGMIAKETEPSNDDATE